MAGSRGEASGLGLGGRLVAAARALRLGGEASYGSRQPRGLVG